MTNIIINNGWESLNISTMIARFICSHLMDPATVEIGIFDFTVDGKTYHVTPNKTTLECDGKTFEHESDWWAAENCEDFDQCCESISEFSSRVCRAISAGKTSFSHDFTSWYEYYGAPESAAEEEKEEAYMDREKYLNGLFVRGVIKGESLSTQEKLDLLDWNKTFDQEKPAQEELDEIDAELHANDIRRAEEDSRQEFLDEVAADEAAAVEQGITYEEYVDNKEAGVYDMLAALDEEAKSAKEEFDMDFYEDPMINFDVVDFKIPLAMPEDIEKQRKNFVFGKLYRLRMLINAITIEQKGTTARRKARRMGLKFWPKLEEEEDAIFAIDTLYTGYAHQRLLDAGLIKMGKVRLRDSHKTACLVEDGTGDIITVTFDGIGRKKHRVRSIVRPIIRHGVWILENTFCEGGVAVVFKNKHGKYQSLTGAVKKLNNEGAMEYWIQQGTARHFMYFIDSPSGYRTGMTPMIHIPVEADGSNTSRRAWLENAINVATGGMYAVEKEANAGEQLRVDKGIKLVGRQALGVTPSTGLGYLNNLAFVIGDLKSKLPDGSEIVAGDGAGSVAVEKIQEEAEKRFGYPISELEAYKFGGQHRINSFVKGHNQVVRRHAILTVIAWLLEMGVIKDIIRLDRTFEDGVKFAKMMRDKAYEDYLVVIGDLQQVEYFGDTTCVKCSTDFSQPLELRLMDISHTPRGFIPLSKQGIVQMQLTGKKFEDMYQEVAPASLDRIFNHVEFDAVDELAEELITDIDVSADAYNIATIQRLCPQAMNHDVQIKRIAVKAIADTVNHRLNRCNLTVSGKYLKLVPDIGRFFNAQLLAADEFYTPGWKSEDDGTGFDAVIIRYPLIDFGAFIKGRAVSRKEMVDRILALDLGSRYKRALLAYLKSITGAMVMIASMVPGTTNKLSGADFDGDGVCLQTEFAVKNVYKDLESYSNDFGGSQPGNVYVEFNYDLGPTSFLYSWALDDASEDREPNPAIGIVAGCNVTVSTMLSMLLMGEITPDQIFHWLKDQEILDGKGNPVLVPAVPGETPYHRLFNADGSNNLGVDVSFAGHETTYVDDFEEAVWMSDWSMESAIRMLWDFNAVLSKSMNDVIDAAKNGAQVKVPFLREIGDRVRSSAVASTDYAEIKVSRSELKIDQFIDVCGSHASKKEQQKMTLLVNDPIGTMKRYIFGLALNRLREALKGEIEQDTVEVSGGTMLDSSIKLLNDFYQDLMKGDGNDKALAKKHVVDMTYALLNRVRITDPEKVLGIVLRASNYAKEDAVPHKYTSFYTQFVEIVGHYVNKLCKDARFEMPVYKFGAGKAYLGEKVTFTNGISDDGFYVGNHVNGEFCLESDEKNRPIISRPVVDMVPQHKGNNKIAVFRIWKQNFNGKCLDPDYNVEKRISRIENMREKAGITFTVKLYNPATQQITDRRPSNIKNIKDYVPYLFSEKYGLDRGGVGFPQVPGGNSTYLEHIVGKTYRITNVMKMGRDLETICVVAEEVG